MSLHLHGEIAKRRGPGDPESASGSVRHALALATQLGMRPLVAHCHLTLGQLLHPTNAREADEHRLRAVTMYRDLDISWWISQAEGDPLGRRFGP